MSKMKKLFGRGKAMPGTAAVETASATMPEKISDAPDYSALFLHNVALTARSGKTVYICGEHHDRLTKILQVVGKNEVSMFSYIYNVLEHHFSACQDDINSLYASNLAQKVF